MTTEHTAAHIAWQRREALRYEAEKQNILMRHAMHARNGDVIDVEFYDVVDAPLAVTDQSGKAGA